MRTIQTVLTVVVLTLAAPALAQDQSSWPLYRGDQQLTGVAHGTLSENFALRWSAETGGPIKSSPVVADGLVVVGSNDGKVHAVDLQTGDARWTFATDGEVEAPPLLLDGRVYVGSADANLYALDARDGSLIWKYQTGDRVLGGANWHDDEDGRRYILVGGYDTKLHCVDAETGEQAWTHATDNYVNATPAVRNGLAVIAGCDGKVHAVRIADGSPTREIDVGAYVAGSAALVDGRAYLGHYGNEFVCVDVDAATVAWTYRQRNFPYFSSPAVHDGVVVFGGRDRRIHALSATDGELRWELSANARVDGSPVICDGKVIVGADDGRLYVLRLADGEELWTYDIGEAISGAAAVAEGMLIIGGGDGVLYAFEPA